MPVPWKPMTRHPWPKAVLFDLDDTLWPIVPVIRAAETILYTWLQQHAPRVAERFTIDSLRQARLELLAREPQYGIDLSALRHAGLIAAFEQAGEDVARVDEAMVVFVAARNAVTLYDDVAPGLARLRQRALLGSVTNGVADLVTIGLADQFQASVAARDFGAAKPDPGIFLAGCAALGVLPADTLYVGDDLLLDVQGAQQAGLRAAWMNRSGKINELAGQVRPDVEVNSIDALLDWLDAAHELPQEPPHELPHGSARMRV
jgi:HAD superfamily hydrolase (TIGR01549 family)